MSEPSPEAKQAVELEFEEEHLRTTFPFGGPVCKRKGYYVQQAIDTAMAKARERVPTADVEKLITKDGALAYFKQFLNGDTGMTSAKILADVMLTVQHQARAPLVEALEVTKMVLGAQAISGPETHAHYVLMAKRLLNEHIIPALVGTGEKEDFAGRTGNNNQIKKEINDDAR